MAHIAHWGALAALVAAMLSSAPRGVPAEPEGAGGQLPAPAGPQEAKPIEPMVGPVKRVAPKTPDLNEPGNTDAEPAGKEGRSKPASKARKVKLVGAKPNCDEGYEPDAAGKSCIKAPSIKAARAKTTKKRRHRR